MQHLLRAADLSVDNIHSLLDSAAIFEQHITSRTRLDRMQGRVLINLFAEPSTRTRLSFERAMLALGGQVQTIGAAESSLLKGESLEDTGRTLSCYGDVIAMRHPTPGAVAALARGARIPVINAGDGSHEHPTQSLLDLYTMKRRVGRLNKLVVGLVGDLKHSRTIHSLVDMLAPFQPQLVCVAPPELGLPAELVNSLAVRGISALHADDLSTVMPELDVLYVTRLQRERFEDLALYERLQASYHVNAASLVGAKKNMVVMHPLPRVNELSPDVDADPRAAYFDQVRYGVPVRMAILDALLDALAADKPAL